MTTIFTTGDGSTFNSAYNTMNAQILAAFLKFVDEFTYMPIKGDTTRYYLSDNELITTDELVNIFLQSDIYSRIINPR
jgi:hypothetical protein